MVKVDLHVHTSCSPDSLIHVDDLLETCDYHGIDCVAVTDHDAVECALKLHEIAPTKIIVGEEIHTTSGEMIGLFLKERIQPWLSPLETIDRIRDQGGLVYIPHPFDKLRKAILGRKVLEEIWEKVDILEVFNSRNFMRVSNRRALKFASEKGMLQGAGSDAHTRYEVGRAYVLMDPFESASDFLSKIGNSEIHGSRTPMMFNAFTKIYKIIRGIGKKSL
jgi:predicted metal-dependent phosphoesterase TrpH